MIFPGHVIEIILLRLVGNLLNIPLCFRVLLGIYSINQYLIYYEYNNKLLPQAVRLTSIMAATRMSAKVFFINGFLQLNIFGVAETAAPSPARDSICIYHITNLQNCKPLIFFC